MRKNPKPTYCIFILALGSLMLFAKGYSQEGSFAPVNPYFVKYIELQKQTALKSASIGNVNFGYMPSPLKLDFGNAKRTKKSAVTLPSHYDLRELGLVTPVKNQFTSNLCWAFASIACVESNWLVNGWGTYDLSEQNMGACSGFNWGYGGGGDDHIPSAYLTRLDGPILESDDPFNISKTTCKAKKFPIPKYVLTSRYLPDDPDLIKETIIKYGGVDASMYATQNHSEMIQYYDSINYTYYFNRDNPYPNHAILVAGWDDNKVVTGGTLSPKGTKGAWIIKNSGGTGFGENGYFYISYYDKGIFLQVYHFDQTVDTSTIENINMYDKLGATKAYGFGTEYTWGLTKFTASKKEIIKKVGTFIVSAGTVIDIEIYKNFSNDSLLNLVYSKKNIYCDYPGQRVFDVVAEVSGDYYIMIKYNTPGYLYPIPVEAEYPGYATPTIEPKGYNWISSDCVKWDTIGQGVNGKEMNLTIRTYTISADKAFAGFDLDKSQLCLGDSIFVKANKIDSTSTYCWKFEPDGISIADTGTALGWVKFPTSGTKLITLIVKNKTGNDSLTRKIEVVTSLDISIIPSVQVTLGNFDDFDLKPTLSYRCAIDKSIALTAFADADSFIWKLPIDTAHGKTIFVKSPSLGINQFSVTGFQGSCIGKDTIEIIGFKRPINDDVCHATELKMDTINGPFSNIDASVEYGEPTPPLYWRDSLKHSVWFWFSPTEEGVYSFITKGFDTEIAIYEADSCINILQDSFKLIASNDNIKGCFAASINGLQVYKGKKYWLQLNGSYGVQTGGFSFGKDTGIFYVDIIKGLPELTIGRKTIKLPTNLICTDTTLINSNRKWIAKCNTAWLTISPDSGIGESILTVTAIKENSTVKQRVVLVYILTSGVGLYSTAVIQPGIGAEINTPIAEKIRIFPNAVKEYLKISLPADLTNEEITIYDIEGRQVYSGKLKTTENTIDVSRFSQGIYIVKLSNTRGIQTQKFVKQ